MVRSLLNGLKIGAALVVLGGVVSYLLGIGPFAAKLDDVAQQSGEALIGGPFSLVDHQGTRVSEADFADRMKLIYFGYTYCPDVCPVGLATATTAYDRLTPEEQAGIVPLFITVDPERDTVEAVADYVDLFHPDLVGLTGTLAEIEAVASAYRVYFRKAESEGMNDYLVDHSSFIYLMDGHDRYVTHFSHGVSVDELVEGLRRGLATPAVS